MGAYTSSIPRYNVVMIHIFCYAFYMFMRQCVKFLFFYAWQYSYCDMICLRDVIQKHGLQTHVRCDGLKNKLIVLCTKIIIMQARGGYWHSKGDAKTIQTISCTTIIGKWMFIKMSFWRNEKFILMGTCLIKRFKTNTVHVSYEAFDIPAFKTWAELYDWINLSVCRLHKACPQLSW